MNTANIFTTGALMLAVGVTSVTAQTGGTAGTQKHPPVQGSTAGQTAAKEHAMQAMPLAPARASEIIGINIEDSTGKDIAEIKDLVVCDDGEVFAVVEVDARDDAWIGVPLNQLHVRLDNPKEARALDKDVPAAAGSETPDIEKFVLKGDRTLFDAAPVLKDDKLIDHTWLRGSVKHYKGTAKTDKPMADTDKDGDTDVTGRMATMSERPTCMKRLIGEDVKGTDGDGIGDVKDVAIDLRNSHVAYAIVSTGGVLGVGNAMRAIPFDRLTINEDSVTIPMTKEGVEKLPSLDLDRLPATSADLGSVSPERKAPVAGHDDHKDG